MIAHQACNLIASWTSCCRPKGAVWIAWGKGVLRSPYSLRKRIYISEAQPMLCLKRVVETQRLRDYPFPIRPCNPILEMLNTRLPTPHRSFRPRQGKFNVVPKASFGKPHNNGERNSTEDDPRHFPENTLSFHSSTLVSARHVLILVLRQCPNAFYRNNNDVQVGSFPC